jgi:hypothetical protein
MVSEFQTNRIMTPAISNPVVSRPVISRRQKLAGPNHHLWFNWNAPQKLVHEL